MLLDFKCRENKICKNYLRTPHIGRTKASDVACPAPSPPLLSPKLFTSHLHHHHQTSDFFSPISHQMSSRLLIQVSLSYLSLRFRLRTTAVGFRDVQRRPDQVPLSLQPLTVFFFEIQISDEILSAAAIADVCRLRGRSSLSIRRTKFSSAGAGKQGGSRQGRARAAAAAEGARCEKVAQLCLTVQPIRWQAAITANGRSRDKGQGRPGGAARAAASIRGSDLI